GDYSISFRVEDPAGLSSTIDVPIHITNVDRPPTLQVDNHSIALGQPLHFRLSAGDPDAGTTLTYAASGLPAGATFDATTGALPWTPGPGQAGDYVVVFSVSDGEQTISQPSLIRAAIAPQGPQVAIELTPSFPALANQPVLVHAIASSLGSITSLS